MTEASGELRILRTTGAITWLSLSANGERPRRAAARSVSRRISELLVVQSGSERRFVCG